ncbi:MAG: ABC transporter ATP-binding protein [Candidatus Wallbacteria bacterium]
MQIAVSVKNLYKIFGNFHAVDGISFDVKKGSIFGFLGPNGAGKSTTIKMLCGLLTPTSGEGSVGGLDITKQQEEIRKRIGYMSQKFSLYDDLTVVENIEFFGSLYGLSGAYLKERISAVLELSELTEKKDVMVKTLPGGIKQRLALGCAILHKPEFLFLDEPTSGVDPISRRNFWNIIHNFARSGITIFVTTHYMEEAEYCDYLVLIYKGRIVIQGTPLELKTKKLDVNIYSAEVDDTPGFYSELQRREDFLEVNMFGDLLHIISKEDTVSVKQKLEKSAAEVNNKILKIEKILPSLEDIFVLAIAAEDARSR